jgi:hypothetical protein
MTNTADLAARLGKKYIDDADTALTDVGNAELFARRHGAVVRYSGRYDTWLVWNGARWHNGHDDKLTLRAIETARARALTVFAKDRDDL